MALSSLSNPGKRWESLVLFIELVWSWGLDSVFMWIVLWTPWARGNGKNINLSGQNLDRTSVYARGKISLILILTKILFKTLKQDRLKTKKRSNLIEGSWENVANLLLLKGTLVWSPILHTLNRIRKALSDSNYKAGCKTVDNCRGTLPLPDSLPYINRWDHNYEFCLWGARTEENYMTQGASDMPSYFSWWFEGSCWFHFWHKNASSNSFMIDRVDYRARWDLITSIFMMGYWAPESKYLLHLSQMYKD